MRNHLIDELTRLAAFDERIMLLTGDLGFNVIEGFAENYPDRYLNCGIAEENMVSVAAGLALEGNIVFVYSLGNFATLRCIEQLRNDICYHNADVKILSVGGGLSYGTLGMTHHATEDLGAMRLLPDMRVYAPADPSEAEGVLQDALRYSGPCYIRLARGSDPMLYQPGTVINDVTGLIPVEPYNDASPEIALICTGTILEEGLGAAAILREKGVKTALYSCPCIKPLNQEKILDLASPCRLIVTAEEHSVIGGLGSAVAEILSSLSEHAPLLIKGLPDTHRTDIGSTRYLRTRYGIDAEGIASASLSVFGGAE